MYRGAGCNPQSLIRGEARTAEQSPGTSPPGLRHEQSQNPLVFPPQAHFRQSLHGWSSIMTMGKAMMRKLTGKMNMTRGPINLTGASIAAFSAR